MTTPDNRASVVRHDAICLSQDGGAYCDCQGLVRPVQPPGDVKVRPLPGDRVQVVADVMGVDFRNLRGETGTVLNRTSPVPERTVVVCLDSRCSLRSIVDHDRFCRGCGTFGVAELRASS